MNTQQQIALAIASIKVGDVKEVAGHMVICTSTHNIQIYPVAVKHVIEDFEFEVDLHDL